MTDLPTHDRDAADVESSRDATPVSLSSAERRSLRARAHGLDPVVMIGDGGLTDGVVAETDRALAAHGLIKVRIFGDDRDARQAMATELEQRTGSALVQAIGKLVVLWRPGADDGASQAAPAPARRRTITVPKKLAAEGKSTTRRRVRPGVPRPTVRADAAARNGPARGNAARGASGAPPSAPRARRANTPRQGPGLRAARGAFDASVARPAAGGTATGVRTGRSAPPARRRPDTDARRDDSDPRSPSRGAGATGRGPAPRGRPPLASEPASRGRADTGGPRSGRASGPPRGRPGPPVRSGTPALRGGAPVPRGAAAPAPRGPRPATGSAPFRPPRSPRPPGPARTAGAGAARTTGARPARPTGIGTDRTTGPGTPRTPRTTGTTGTTATTGTAGPVRSGTRGGQRGGTGATGSARPGPRTRAGRRGP